MSPVPVSNDGDRSGGTGLKHERGSNVWLHFSVPNWGIIPLKREQVLLFTDDLSPLETATADNCELLNVACAGGRHHECLSVHTG